MTSAQVVEYSMSKGKARCCITAVIHNSLSNRLNDLAVPTVTQLFFGRWVLGVILGAEKRGGVPPGKLANSAIGWGCSRNPQLTPNVLGPESQLGGRHGRPWAAFALVTRFRRGGRVLFLAAVVVGLV
jgi:hypothetical protein